MSATAFAFAPFTLPPPSRVAAAPLREAAVPVDAIVLAKALASQLIVWHHLVLYGPLRGALAQWAPALTAWLRQDGRLAVQAFLVVGGYLAAGSIWRAQAQGRPWAQMVAARWWRLVKPYALALLAAMLAAWAARLLVADADTPAVPTAAQMGAHLLLLHDVLGVPALSAGVWYVAIDLQLFALWAALLALTRGRVPLPLVLLAGLAASLLVFNLEAGGDNYAPYFFGTWGLGVAAWWLRAQGWQRPAARGLALALVALLLVALTQAWRERVALAAAVAVVLALAPARGLVPGRLRAGVTWLADHSYGVFLMHYPVLLLVGALGAAAGLVSPAAAAAVMGVGWLASLAAGAALHRLTQARLSPAPAVWPVPGPWRPAARGW